MPSRPYEAVVLTHTIPIASKSDRAAFRDLYQSCAPRLSRFAIAYCGDAERAAEAVQDAFLDLYKRPSQYDPARGSVEALLFGMVRNRLRSARRQDRDEPLLEESPSDEDLLAGLDRNQRVAAVREAILRLPEHYREVVLLCEIEEWSYEEAAHSLDVPVGTVRSRLHRARALLKEMLREFGGPDASR